MSSKAAEPKNGKRTRNFGTLQVYMQNKDNSITLISAGEQFPDTPSAKRWMKTQVEAVEDGADIPKYALMRLVGNFSFERKIETKVVEVAATS